MNLVSFVSSIYTTSPAVITYTLPRRATLVGVRWQLWIATNAVSGMRWTLSPFPTDPANLVGAEGVISSVQAVGSGTSAFTTNFDDVLNPGLVLDAGQLLYFHALALIAAPGVGGSFMATLKFK